MMWYIYGNLSEAACVELVEDARAKIHLAPLAVEKLRAVRHINLPAGESCRLDFEVPDEKNDNSCCMVYFQGPQASDHKTQLISRLALQYLEQPTFDQLRTVEQLGYVVAARRYESRDVNGAWIIVQSPGSSSSKILQSVDKHMQTMWGKVKELTEKDF